MQSHFCQGFLISFDSAQPVSILANQGSLTIQLISNDQQIVYLPKGQLDTIIQWFRSINQQNGMGTLDINNPETQIQATFDVPLQDLIKLEQMLRGRQLYFRKPYFKPLAQIAQSIILVQQEGLNRKLIQKSCIFPALSNDPKCFSSLEQLKQEAEILMYLKDNQHKNIIEIEEVNVDLISMQLMLENCEGGDLLKVLNQKQIQIKPKIIMQNLLQGIAHLHKHQIIHRDIKLQNVLLKTEDQNSLKIIDFGLSCRFNQIMLFNPRCGTPGYTAPEIFDQSKIYNEKVDLYSCGIIFYNLLTRKNPFGNSKNTEEILNRNINGIYDMQHLEIIKQQDSQAYELVTKLLSKDPQLRPTANECLNHRYFNQFDLEEEQCFDVLHLSATGVHQKVKVQQQKHSSQMPKPIQN